jgi:hypothetical protein
MCLFFIMIFCIRFFNIFFLSVPTSSCRSGEQKSMIPLTGTMTARSWGAGRKVDRQFAARSEFFKSRRHAALCTRSFSSAPQLTVSNIELSNTPLPPLSLAAAAFPGPARDSVCTFEPCLERVGAAQVQCRGREHRALARACSLLRLAAGTFHSRDDR